MNDLFRKSTTTFKKTFQQQFSTAVVLLLQSLQILRDFLKFSIMSSNRVGAQRKLEKKKQYIVFNKVFNSNQ